MDDAKAALRRASLSASHALYSSRRRNISDHPTSEADEAYVMQLFSSNAFEQVCAHVDRLVNFNRSHVSKTILELRGRSLLRMSEYMLALDDFRQILNVMDSDHLEARAYYKVSAKMSARHCLLKARRLKEGVRTPLGQANPTAMEFPSTHSSNETPFALSEKVLKLYTVALGFAEQLLGGYICDFQVHPHVGSPERANWGGTGYGQGVEGDVGESLGAGSAAPDEVWQLILAARIGRAIELVSLDRAPEATTELAICRQLAVHIEDGVNGSEYNAPSSAGASPSISHTSLSSMGNFDSLQSLESQGRSMSPSMVSQLAFFEDSEQPERTKEDVVDPIAVSPSSTTQGSTYTRRSRVSSAIVALQPGDPSDVISPGILLRAHFDTLLLRADDFQVQGDLEKAGELWADAVGMLPKPVLATTPSPGLSAVAALQQSTDTDTFQQETDTDVMVDPFLKAIAYHNHGVSLMRSKHAEEAAKTFSSVLAVLQNRVGSIPNLDPTSQAGRLAYKSKLCRGIALLALGLGAAPFDPEGGASLDNVFGYVAKAHAELLGAEQLVAAEDLYLRYALAISHFCLGDESSAHKHLVTVLESTSSSSLPARMQDGAQHLMKATEKLMDARKSQTPAEPDAKKDAGNVDGIMNGENCETLNGSKGPPNDSLAA